MNILSSHFLWVYAKSNLRLKYRHTYLGFLWHFLEPALYLIVLSVIFSVINRMNVRDYAVYLFSALLPWRYFESMVSSMMESIVGGEWLLKRMSVSPLTFPISKWIIATFEFFYSFLVVLIIFVFLKKAWTIHFLILPFSLIPWSILGLGVGLIAAVLFTFFRDIKPIIQMFLIFVFFSSPILFQKSVFEGHFMQALLMTYHPIAYFAALFQKPIYYATWPSYADWAVSLSLSISLFILGYSLNRRSAGKYYFYL